MIRLARESELLYGRVTMKRSRGYVLDVDILLSRRI